ncbi:MAG: hypothetical protein WKF36_10350 [Candidatus Nitrosocosmicus sp.]
MIVHANNILLSSNGKRECGPATVKVSVFGQDTMDEEIIKTKP